MTIPPPFPMLASNSILDKRRQELWSWNVMQILKEKHESRNRVVNQHCSLKWSIVLRACHGAMLRTYYRDNSRRSCQQKWICIERERVLNVMFINVLRIHLHLRVWVYIADNYVYITCVYIYIYLYLFIYAHIYIYTYVIICTYVHIHIHIHNIYIYTQLK